MLKTIFRKLPGFAERSKPNSYFKYKIRSAAFVCVIMLGALSVVYLPIMTVYNIALPDEIPILKIDKVIYRFEANKLVPIGLISGYRNSSIRVKEKIKYPLKLKLIPVNVSNFLVSEQIDIDEEFANLFKIYSRYWENNSRKQSDHIVHYLNDLVALAINDNNFQSKLKKFEQHFAVNIAPKYSDEFVLLAKYRIQEGFSKVYSDIFENFGLDLASGNFSFNPVKNSLSEILGDERAKLLIYKIIGELSNSKPFHELGSSFILAIYRNLSEKKLELYESDFNSIETVLQKLMLETSEWMADIFSLEQKNTNPMLLALLSNYTIRRKNNIDYILVLDNESLQRVENNYLSFNVDITR
jgi:hypothetical protein